MTSISLKNLNLDYPILDANSKSLKRVLLATAGGQRVRHPTIRALEDINLEVQSGERIGLYGPNGSGKTTLLRTLAGIFPISGGEMRVDGAVTPLLGLAVGVNHDISADQNIRLLLRVDGIVPTDPLIDAIWNFTDLEEKMRYMPLRTFSSGMLMRVLFAVSTASSPEILLLDEWLSVVDKTFSEKAEQRMNALVSRTRILVLASHNLQMLERVCTRVVHLQNGRIIADVPVVAPVDEPAATVEPA